MGADSDDAEDPNEEDLDEEDPDEEDPAEEDPNEDDPAKEDPNEEDPAEENPDEDVDVNGEVQAGTQDEDSSGRSPGAMTCALDTFSR